ncbi:MAG TPA: tetratricopeptide repeat protein, partial [Abditibacteriaceae bacterium]|nr:tetratricopeptide repeat protein [Abditibacteriaceae bacterium]
LALRAQTVAPPTVASTSTPTTIENLPSRAPIAANIEGTVQLLRFGWTQSAQIKFSAPDSLWVHIQGDKAHLSADEIYVAQSSTQTTFSADSRRVRQWRWSSVREPWRSDALADAGPANIWLWGWNPANVAPFYNVATTKSSDLTTVVMTAKPGRARLVRDALRSGGRGDRLFYAPFKRAIYDWPRRVTLKLNASNAPMWMEKRDERNRVLETTAFSWKSDGWPLSATTRDGNNHVTGQWKYDLKPAASKWSADTFDLSKATGDASANQIVEDAELLPLSDYATQKNADAQFNAGVVQARHAEDWLAAFAAWGAASVARPQAVAPLEEAFDGALTIRDLPRAARVLEALSGQLKENDPALLNRRVSLGVLRRDWSDVATNLNLLQQSNPANLSTRLQRANLLRLGGAFAQARAVLIEILASPTQQLAGQSEAFQDQTQVGAAQILAQMLRLPSLKTVATSTLQTLPKTTTAQKLARSILALQLGQTPETTTFSNDAAQAAWADAQTMESKTADAIASWQIVARRASLGFSMQAHRNLIMLFARRGDIRSSLIEYSIVAARDEGEDARNATRNLLFEVWRAASKTDVLRQALQTRASTANATEDDARLWLAWQELNATPTARAQTVRVMATRFPKSAWWQSRLGEQLVSEAAALKRTEDIAKERLTAQALQTVRRAVALDANQPYYPIQAALILTLRANDFRKAAISSAGVVTEATQAARQELQNLRRKYPDDPDVAIAVAFAGQALAARYEGDLELLQSGLQDGLPARAGDGDRHLTTFAARQALAIALRRQKQWGPAARQMQLLMLAARDPGEELGIAVNYLSLLGDADAAGAGSGESSTRTDSAASGAAQFLARLASEPWPLAAAESATRSFATLLQNNDKVWPQAAAVLRASKQPSTQLGAAYFFFSLENGLTAMSKKPSQDAAAQASIAELLKRVQNESSAAEANLPALVEGADKIVAARAASLLGGRALSRGDTDEAISRLQSAVENEPDSLEMRLALMRAFVVAKRPEDAIRTRDATLQALPLDATTTNRVAALPVQ